MGSFEIAVSCLSSGIALSCYGGQVPRPLSPDVRSRLVERAAQMLARREPVSLRSLVAGTGVSTMAVYTYFGGMPGLWQAVRQEGFERLSARLARIEPTTDPVRDLAAMGVAYTENALADPDLYRTMFDAAVEAEDPGRADLGFRAIVEQARRAQQAGRFAADADPEALALRYWASGHGRVMLVVTGALPEAVLAEQAPRVAVALFVDAGDDPARCAESVAEAWATTR